MNNNRRYNAPARQRKSKWKKEHKIILVMIAALLVSVITSLTFAFVFMGTDPLINTFNDSHVACDVYETFNGTTKTDVVIQNTGDVQSYIRAAVVVTWMSEDGAKVTAQKPVAGTDYNIVYAGENGEATDWVLGADGYWYYTKPVNPRANANDPYPMTEVLIESCSLIDGVTPPEGFYLSVEIVASAIQSTPTTVVMDQWSSGVSGIAEDGTTLEIKQPTATEEGN